MVATFVTQNGIQFELNFETQRLLALNARVLETDEPLRKKVVAQLGHVLTEDVLKPLPDHFSMQGDQSSPEGWLRARIDESEVLLLLKSADETLIGLVFLYADQQLDNEVTLHTGYLFAEQFWGQGFASEMVAGLVKQCRKQNIARLAGGVEIGNAASARVLTKSGFKLDEKSSTTETEHYVLDL